MGQNDTPDLMRALPVKDLDRFLEQTGATLPCPRCGNTKFMKMNEAATNQHATLVLESLGDSDAIDRTDRFPVIPTTCTRCGWIALHMKALVVAGAAAAKPMPPVLPSPARETAAAEPQLAPRLQSELSEIRALLSRMDERTFYQATRADLGVTETNVKGRIEHLDENLRLAEERILGRIGALEASTARYSGLGRFLGRSILAILLVALLGAALLRWEPAIRAALGL